MREYRISVIMPVYNAQRFLDNAMDSLLRQTIGFEHLQVIMVDDCSTDDSAKIMAEYAQKYANILLLRTQENSGAAGLPRNTALAHVQAPYIMFLDPDDYYDRNACQVLYDKIRESRAQIVGGYCDYVDENGENPYTRPGIFPAKEKEFRLPEQMNDALGFCDIICIRIFDAGFIRENAIRFLDSGFGEDTVFIYRCFMKPSRMIYIPKLVYHYRKNEASATHRISKKFFLQYLNCMQTLREELKPFPKTFRCVMEGHTVHYFEVLIRQDEMDSAALEEIFRDCSVLFDSEIYYHKQIKYASDLIRSGRYDQAAEYIAVLRDQYDLINAYEGRFAVRIANAIHDRRWLDVVRIVYKTIKKKLKG